MPRLIALALVFLSTVLAPIVKAEMPVLVLEGTPRERGLTHGRMLRGEIQQAVAQWKAGLSDAYKMDADVFIERFIASTDYLPAIRKWTPGLAEEVSGIAEGAGLDFKTVLAFQLVDESWTNGEWVAANHCSTIGLGKAGAHGAFVAQNMDLEGFRDGFQAVLHVKEPSGLESFVFTEAGLIALNGVNSRGVGVVVNTLSQLAFGREGLPVAFVVRGILSQETAESAVRFVNQVPHASGQNYIVGGPQAVYDFEASAGKVARVEPPPGSRFFYHTNHPLVNENYNEKYRRVFAEQDKSVREKDNSHTRYQSLEKRFDPGVGADPVAQIQEVLRSRDSELHPVCRKNTGKSSIFTFGSTLMLLSGEPELLVAPGPPDAHPYRSFRFNREETPTHASKD